MELIMTKTKYTADVAPIIIDGESLTIDKIVKVAAGEKIRLSDEEAVIKRIQASHNYIIHAAEIGLPIYGVTTGFGGMANIIVPKEAAVELQNNLIWSHKAAVGKVLPIRDIRASMLLRANSLMQGISGIRLEIIQRLETFLNAGVTPHVLEYGSIGASGDLVPLAYIAGCIIGRDAAYKVDFNGQEMDCISARAKLGLAPMRLEPKEGLALINGTAVMAGIAANCVYDAQQLLTLAMSVHALAIQALHGTNQSFHPFIHQHKAHPGQLWAASTILHLLTDSKLIRNELDGKHDYRHHDLIQDRYSLRCLPQYMGPIVDGISLIKQQIEIEANSATDNPLIDVANNVTYHGGNFLGQYVGVGMDQLRYHLGLLAKHIDVQIALLVSPEFNNGLAPSLVGNPDRRVNTGLKALQIAGNSMMPLITFFGNSLVDRFPTHAEQFNQNINSQGFGSANLPRQSIEIFQQYMAIALMFTVQAVDLRTKLLVGHYDSRATLSPATLNLYTAVRQVIDCPPNPNRPLIWNDNDQHLDAYVARIAADIMHGGKIQPAINNE